MEDVLRCLGRTWSRLSQFFFLSLLPSGVRGCQTPWAARAPHVLWGAEGPNTFPRFGLTRSTNWQVPRDSKKLPNI